MDLSKKQKIIKKEIKRDIVPIAEELLKEICEQQIKSSWWIARRESNYLFSMYEMKLYKRASKKRAIVAESVAERIAAYNDSGKKGARLGFPVKFAGKWYQLISNPTTADASTEYYAYAMSWGDVDDENEYIVTWQVKKEWLEMDEKERMMSMLLKRDIVEACNWETPVKITIRDKKKGGRVNG